MDIRVPDMPANLAAKELPSRLLDLGSKFFYMLSFPVMSLTGWLITASLESSRATTGS
ncbi:MAG: hypothetical protein JOZ19_08320 [Rubrobacter sp.]|nr:hypothetical protein [Rubrobacter sp.]